jgi:Tfp pilus assembly protein FimV
MTRTRVRRRRSLAIVSLGVAAAVWAAPVGHALAGGPSGAAGAADASPSVERYVVRPGDTLWSIARQISPEVDPRQVVDALQQVNGVDAGRLIPGREIVIPGQV